MEYNMQDPYPHEPISNILRYAQSCQTDCTCLGPHTRPICRLNDDLQTALVSGMDTPDALAWRAVCHTTYEVVTGVFRRTKNSILHRFFPEPAAFLYLLTQCRAVVGGVAALSLVLRDPSVQDDLLQVYVGYLWYLPFLMAVTSCPLNGGEVTRIRKRTFNRQIAREREIMECTILFLRNGRAVAIYRTGCVSAPAAIAKTSCTALINFFTEHTFACGYPALTDSGRTLMCDKHVSRLLQGDFYALGTVLRAGFTFGMSAAYWAEYSGLSEDGDPKYERPCFREPFLCPQQDRFFGDKGSIIDLLDPLDPVLRLCDLRTIPPFGATVAWRLNSTFTCDGGCDVKNEVLHEWGATTPIVVIPNPFVAALPKEQAKTHHTRSPAGDRRRAVHSKRSHSV